MTQPEPKIGDSPKFTNPPVVEVVMGVQFDPLDKMQAVHFAEFFSLWKSDYPTASDRPPIAPAAESFGDDVFGRKTLRITIGEPEAQLPRQWFEAENGNLIQIQRDRFVVNWRQVGDEDYPSYESIRPLFLDHFKKFRERCAKLELGEISPDLLELTYVNHIKPHKDFWSEHGQLSKVFPFWNDAPSERKVLKNPSHVKWEMAYDIPDRRIRLRVTCNPVFNKQTKEHAIRLEMLARGAANEWSDSGIGECFDIAHHWIVWGFVDITSSLMQDKVWLRKKEDQ